MSFPRYAEYKDSGVEWLGEIPSGWGVKRHKYIATFLKGKNPDVLLDNYVNGLYPYLSMDSLRGKAESKYAKYGKGLILVEDNQPLIIWDGSNSGEFVLGKKGILSSTMASAFLLYELNSRFYWYMCVCIEPEMRKNATGMGIPHVNGEELRGISLPIPDIDEQTTIAAFLDCETAKIDNLINEQKKLIELLKEKRQAVISTAVTKGLNPNAPMKDSGVEWLGEVPQEWEVKPIKKLGNIVSGYAFPSSDFVKDGEIRVLKISNIQTGYLDWSDESYLPKSSYIDNFSIKNGDIIFALTRPIISTGIKAAVATIAEGEIVLLNQRNALFRPFPIAERKFLYYILFDYNFKAAFENCIDSTGQQPNISPIDIGNIFVAVPPINEQTTIVAFLDQETAKIDNLIQQAQKATTLLQERRTALISAAVTGKIDVREYKSLPASLC